MRNDGFNVAAIPVMAMMHRLGIAHSADVSLFRTALIHRSCRLYRNVTDDNERLEYLGNTVLKMIVVKWLYGLGKSLDEGMMTLVEAKICSNQTLSSIAQKHALGEFIQVSHLSRRLNHHEHGRVLADVVEAIIGAHFLTLGMENTECFVMTLLADHLPRHHHMPVPNKHPKNLLNETVMHRFGCTPTYETDGNFERHRSVVCAMGKGIGVGYGKTKKEAETNAAIYAMERLNEMEPTCRLPT